MRRGKRKKFLGSYLLGESGRILSFGREQNEGRLKECERSMGDCFYPPLDIKEVVGPMSGQMTEKKVSTLQI